MAELRPVRGTHDLIGEDARRHRAVIETARAVAERYRYEDIATPIFEFAEVFTRPLGDTSDIVTKETYTFEDRGGEKLTLRPENTAAVCRALLSNGLLQNLPLRFFYAGPMFRYERPQKGRQRQFHQIGIELLGAPEPFGDVEVIACGARVLAELGIAADITLELNTLGDAESRTAYRDELVAYLRRFEADLSEDSRARLSRNPLRILDSKDEGDRELLQGAPVLEDSLNAASRAFFVEVRAGLDSLAIPYTINPRLVRGLDYYGHTAFEFATTALGAQGTVMGGGRYDGLVEMMGGPPTAGVGWAAGIERLAMLLAEPPAQERPVAVISVDESTSLEALVLAEELRAANVVVEHALRGKVGQRLKRAARARARYAVVIGPDELAAGQVQLRDLDRGEQEAVARVDLVRRLGA
ncbi:histidine--tRNA ligase [Marinivivus vitaminiproducens]|uniref:histidine--tRNA ligase n=1 Tax=Marinivivus vitaminiproducens TaxID=3035935 RepID=UPI0027A2763D|nr:histidine--tRNA ligase [Geminicoccaceae bacterium SCSIO 64248]